MLLVPSAADRSASVFQLMLACLVVAAAGRPQDDGLQSSASTLEDAGILRMESSQSEDGSFQYAFETADQIKQEVSGQLKQIGEELGIVMQGSYSFVAKDENGQDVPVEVRWVADENGYRAEGDSIPQLGENGAGQRDPNLISADATGAASSDNADIVILQ